MRAARASVSSVQSVDFAKKPVASGNLLVLNRTTTGDWVKLLVRCTILSLTCTLNRQLQAGASQLCTVVI